MFFRLQKPKPLRPIKPEPRRSKEAGSGTGCKFALNDLNVPPEEERVIFCVSENNGPPAAPEICVLANAGDPIRHPQLVSGVVVPKSALPASK